MPVQGPTEGLGVRAPSLRSGAASVLRLLTGNPSLGLPGASTANSPSWASRSPPPPCGKSSRPRASTRPHTDNRYLDRFPALTG